MKSQLTFRLRGERQRPAEGSSEGRAAGGGDGVTTPFRVPLMDRLCDAGLDLVVVRPARQRQAARPRFDTRPKVANCRALDDIGCLQHPSRRGHRPVDIGMSRQDAKRAMEATGHSVDPSSGWRTPRFSRCWQTRSRPTSTGPAGLRRSK
ncbi:MAG: hypothetical protein AVDCRST_MAG67-1407 [uncultured Solirubrobacteraceae bacterium]|uniref:Uncharacterized protein n=1 Tax=uncultured Solirubrobacteraceae bacterium TaxID=1162706 RepID=A0A6J4S7I4_9ACTN|nr:MAG: hypothetical protein AVDCRST_MAG67-1407 [uncultured Solirubrobacteraceae bacterium]